MVAYPGWDRLPEREPDPDDFGPGTALYCLVLFLVAVGVLLDAFGVL